jgi:cathepsin D
MNALVGLGFAAQSSANVTPIVQTLRNQNQLPTPVFGFKLSQNNSELMLGGTNKNLYKGKPTYIPVTSDVSLPGSI